MHVCSVDMRFSYMHSALYDVRMLLCIHLHINTVNDVCAAHMNEECDVGTDPRASLCAMVYAVDEHTAEYFVC